MSRRWRCTSGDESTSAIFARTCSACSSSPALKKSCASSNGASRRCSCARSSRFTRSWCMRMARSTSPRRRKRLPSANCSSTVWGFSLATCRNDSIALSGCSLSRKFKPRKYEEGSARDSDSSDFKPPRAAIQPMPKKTGRATSHQNSNSMDLGSGGLALRVRHERGQGRLLLGRTPQPSPLPPPAPARGNPCEEPDHAPRHERHEQDEDEGRLPDLAG